MIAFAGGFSAEQAAAVWIVNRVTGEVFRKTDPYAWAYFVHADETAVSFAHRNSSGELFLNVFDPMADAAGTIISRAIYNQPVFVGSGAMLAQVGHQSFEIWNLRRSPIVQLTIPYRLGYGTTILQDTIADISVDGVLRLFSLKDGSLLFDKKIADEFNSDLVASGGVVSAIMKRDGAYFLIGFDIAAQKEKWRHVLPQVMSTHNGTVVADNARIYVTGDYRNNNVAVRAINSANGEIVWSYGTTVSRNGTLAQGGGNVLYVVEDKFFIFDGATGRMLLESTLSDIAIPSALAVTEDAAYIATEDCVVRAHTIPQKAEVF